MKKAGTYYLKKCVRVTQSDFIRVTLIKINCELVSLSGCYAEKY